MNALDDILEIYGAHIYNTPALHGFYSAMVCTPSITMPPKQQTSIIFGNEEMVWDNEQDAILFIEETIKIYNKLLEVLNQKQDYRPYYYTDDENNPIIEDWITGFVMGVQCLPNFWQILLEDKEQQELLRPIITLYNADNLPLGFLKLNQSKMVTREECIEMLNVNIPKIFDYYKPYRINFMDYFHNRHKLGRNDMCPCGSGKKYKRCCINITFH